MHHIIRHAALYSYNVVLSQILMAYSLYLLAVVIIFLLSLPIQAAVALLIVVTSGFPIFFQQKRVGLKGKPFVMYKFRTMITQAEAHKSKYQRLNESHGPTFKIHNDPRFTRVGRILSHIGLDELPQLINVIKGDMAFVGPRPLPISEAKKMKPWMRERERVLPGIISPAILTGKYHQDFNAWMRNDVAYARNKTVWRDAILLIEFIPFVAWLLGREVRRGIEKR